MKLALVFVASLCGLSLFACSDVPNTPNPSNLANIPSDLLRIVASYLDNPFLNLGSLNHHFENVFSKDLPVKSFIKERFDVPELITAYVDDNEKELKYILSFSRFKSSDHINQVLRHNFFNGNKFDALIPHLMKYFRRMYPEKSDEEEINALIEYKKYSYFFQSDPLLFNDNAARILDYVKGTQDLREYILSNPDHFEYMRQYFKIIANTNDRYLIIRWIKTALATNMPDTFIFGLIDNEIIITSLDKMPSLWKELHVPRIFYPGLYQKLNIMINDLSDENDVDFYSVLNLIRFGPEVHDIYESQIKPKSFSNRRLLLLCHCASLANKMDVFSKLIYDIKPYIIKKPREIDQRFYYDYDNTLFEMHKFIIDVHECADQSFRQSIYSGTRFFNILSSYCQVVSIQLGKNEVKIEFKVPTESIANSFPKKVNYNQTFSCSAFVLDFVLGIPNTVKFESSELFGTFLSDFFDMFLSAQFKINSENLKLIIKSESLLQLIKKHCELNQRSLFIIDSNDLLDVINEPVPVVSLEDILQLRINVHDGLSYFKTAEQLKRLEIISGFSVNSILKPNSDYFNERNVYKYLIETGQELPNNISENTRALIKIDYPLINL